MFTYDDIFTKVIVNVDGSFSYSVIPNYENNFNQYNSNWYPYSDQSRSEILAWFKGVNLQPTETAKNRYIKYILAYLLDIRKDSDTNIDQGIFIKKS